MPDVDKDWVKQQMAKAISAEQSVLKAEKDHRDRTDRQEIVSLYDRLIRDDEKHLDELKRIAGKYGHEAGGMMESAGGLLGGVKSAVEEIGTADPFQTIGDDLMMKSNSLNYDKAWTKIFQDIGDYDSAEALELAAREDEEHQAMMRETLTNVGLMEAHGERIKEK